MASPKDAPAPTHPQNLGVGYFTWERGIKVAGGIKWANQLTLKWKLILDHPDGPVPSQGASAVGEGDGRRELEGDVAAEAGSEQCRLAGLEVEEGATSQGLQAALDARGGQGTGFPLEPPEGGQP